MESWIFNCFFSVQKVDCDIQWWNLIWVCVSAPLFCVYLNFHIFSLVISNIIGELNLRLKKKIWVPSMSKIIFHNYFKFLDSFNGCNGYLIWQTSVLRWSYYIQLSKYFQNSSSGSLLSFRKCVQFNILYSFFSIIFSLSAIFWSISTLI